VFVWTTGVLIEVGLEIAEVTCKDMFEALLEEPGVPVSSITPEPDKLLY
jgi:hypothetical protein